MRAQIIFSVLLVISNISIAENSGVRNAKRTAELHRNVRDMRLIIEQEAADASYAARNATLGLFLDTADTAGISQRRQELNGSLERFENKCIGMDAEVENGNLIIICGDNVGQAENTDIDNQTPTNIFLPPEPSAPPAPELKP